MKALASPGHIAARPQRRRLSLGDCDIPRACVRPVFTGAETAPLRENRVSRHLRTLRAGRSVLGRPCREGAGSARPDRKARASPRHVPSWPPAHRQPIGCKWNASALVGPRNAGAQSAPLRENHISRHLGALPARRPVLSLGPPRRGGLCTPEKKCMGGPKHVPPWATGFSPEEPVGRRRLGTGKVLSRECADQGSLGLLDIWLEAT